MSDPPLILVVDDEQSYRDALSVALQREGFLVETAADGPEAVARFDATKPALVLLDVMLPKVSGIDVCRELRTRSRVPIIMVTARNAEIDAVVGLEVGADDYVTKPFRLRELIARVRAALRRVPITDEGRDHPEILEVGDVRLDAARHEVQVRGTTVALPLKEFELLELLMANAAESSRVMCSSTGSGDRTTSVTPRRSTFTSSGCVPRSNPIPRARVASSPCGESDTGTNARR